MSRSLHNGCGRAKCGVCRPHKKWKRNSPKVEAPRVRRVLQKGDNA